MHISQGLKAGLAAGVIYGGMVGLLHLGTLEACSSVQISYIQHELLTQNAPSNETAAGMFETDLLYFPMVYGIWGLIYGVIFGIIFAALYLRLPGSSSKKKAMSLAIPVFLIGVFAGPAYVYYQCSPSFLPLISLGLGLPASFIFGYFLGLFYDSFGRLAAEESGKAKLGNSDPSQLRSFFSGAKFSQFRKRASLLLHEPEAYNSKWRLIRQRDFLSPR